jgi:hypothetical protein
MKRETTMNHVDPVASCLFPIGGFVLAVSEFSVQNTHDGQTGIKPNEISQGKRAHRYIGSQFPAPIKQGIQLVP